jgi:hypothetical protein
MKTIFDPAHFELVAAAERRQLELERITEVFNNPAPVRRQAGRLARLMAWLRWRST